MSVIEVDGLTERYDDETVVDVSFSVEQGEIFAIVGPNGAGKTTTVESIAGLRTPDSGRIEALGQWGINGLADDLRSASELIATG